MSSEVSGSVFLLDGEAAEHFYWTVSHTCGLEHSGVTVAVTRRERLHHPVDLLGFTWEPEAPQKLPDNRFI